MTGIIDYGSGNLKSVYNAFRFIGEDVRVVRTPDQIKLADKLVLPGVGSSMDAMKGLERSNMLGALKRCIGRGTYFLGICLGLQLLFSKSTEGRGCRCLDLIKGVVKRFPPEKAGKVPQIGWNTVELERPECPLFRDIPDKSYFYFVHSYYCQTREPEYTAGTTSYGLDYTSVVWKDNLFAVQFHPERSQKNGLNMLRNFAKL